MQIILHWYESVNQHPEYIIIAQISNQWNTKGLMGLSWFPATLNLWAGSDDGIAYHMYDVDSHLYLEFDPNGEDEERVN